MSDKMKNNNPHINKEGLHDLFGLNYTEYKAKFKGKLGNVCEVCNPKQKPLCTQECQDVCPMIPRSDKMNNFQIVEKKHMVYPEIETHIPVRKSMRSAEYYFKTKTDRHIGPGNGILIWTDIRVQMFIDEFLSISIVDELAMAGFIIPNAPSIFNFDYHDDIASGGNIFIMLFNISPYKKILRANEEIAKGIFMKYIRSE